MMQSAIRLFNQVHEKLFQIALMIATLFAPIQGIMITVGLTIFADTALGLWKAKKLGEKIISRKLARVITKMLLYQTTIALFFLIDKFILGDILASLFSIKFLLTKIIALVLASIEVFSMDENIRAVKGTGLWHAFKKLTGVAKAVSKDLQEIKTPKSDNKEPEI